MVLGLVAHANCDVDPIGQSSFEKFLSMKQRSGVEGSGTMV